MTEIAHLRPYLDALADDALSAVLDRPFVQHSPRRSATRRLVAVVATAGVAALGALLLVSNPSSTTQSVVRPGKIEVPSGEAGSAPVAAQHPDCVRVDSNLGCERTPAQAARMLGIPIGAPAVIPGGWSAVRKVVRVFPAGSRSNPTAEDIADYSRVWAPGGSVPDHVPNPRYLRLVERAVLVPGEGACPDRQHLTLNDGTAVCGSVSLSDGGSSPVDWSGWLEFQRDAVYSRVLSLGLTESQVLAFLNSIREPRHAP